MIENYFTYILSKLNNLEEVKTSSHIPAAVMEPVEEELLLSRGYSKRRPPNFPTDDSERILGVRRLRKPYNTDYLRMKLRIGMSTLHIKDRGSLDNIDSIAMFYMGEAEEKDLLGASGHSVKEAAIVNFLDNGVVSGCYFNTFNIINVLSWFPDGKSDYGGWPYPKNKIEVEEKIRYILSKSNTSSDSRAFRAIPDLVMLCTQAYKEVFS